MKRCYEMKRDALGRSQGDIFAFHNYNEDESYKDQKVLDVRFPIHNEKSSPVTTYKIMMVKWF
ncbi:hypothetical protein AB1283_26190 [Bacillus sp. S13(2024)]|uniref:hypothetical protein n=1 Tax=Bacillus sp. S13(2024) TaxID=3162885 RepID=UPI003D21225A